MHINCIDTVYMIYYLPFSELFGDFGAPPPEKKKKKHNIELPMPE